MQGARSNTTSETNGRITLFLGTVSSGLIALGFIGADAGDTFFVFGLILFPLLFLIGLLTFERVLQSSIEDIFYARGINRIRHFYTELVPEMAPILFYPSMMMSQELSEIWGQDRITRNFFFQVQALCLSLTVSCLRCLCVSRCTTV